MGSDSNPARGEPALSMDFVSDQLSDGAGSGS
jgi:hypothetical protein